MYDTKTCLSGTPHPAIDFDKWQSMVDLMSKIYGAACGAVVQLREDEFNPVVASLNEDNFLHRDLAWPWEMKSFCRSMMETKEGLYVANPTSDPNWSDAPPVETGPVRSYCGLPIFWPDGSLFGSICVIDVKPTSYDTNLIELLEQMRHIITSDLKSIIDFETILNMAFTDEQTGVFNRRGLREKSALDQSESVGVAYFDIDNLKQINDQCGHEEGDYRITSLAKLLKDNCRKDELVARLGGDEFIVIFYDISETEINKCCQRINASYQAIETSNCIITPSVSYGYKVFNSKSTIGLEKMITQADQLMYNHKKKKQ